MKFSHLIALCLFLVAHGAASRELRLSHFMPVEHVLHSHILVPWAEAVEKATDGEVTVRIYPARELGSGARAQLDRVIDGIVDIAFGVQGYTSALFPGTLVAELPGLAETSPEVTRMLWRGMRGPLAREYRRVKVLALWTNAPAMIMTRERPVRRLEDMKGLRIRVPSAQWARIVEAWGATPISLSGSDIYLSLQTGVIDGVMIGASGIVPFKLTEVANYYTRGLPTSVSTFFVAANLDSWKRLGKDHQAAIEAISGEPFSLVANSVFLDDGERGLALVRADDRLELIDLSGDEAERFSAAARTVWGVFSSELENKGLSLTDILAAMRGS